MIEPTDADRAEVLAEYRRRRAGRSEPPYVAMRGAMNMYANIQAQVLAEGGQAWPSILRHWAAARCYETWMLQTGGHWIRAGRRPA